MLAPKDLVAAISQEDVERIDAVPGVGAKVAERIVRELRDKIKELNLSAPLRMETAASSNGQAGGGSLLDDAVSPLINLGYKLSDRQRLMRPDAAPEASFGTPSSAGFPRCTSAARSAT